MPLDLSNWLSTTLSPAWCALDFLHMHSEILILSLLPILSFIVYYFGLVALHKCHLQLLYKTTWLVHKSPPQAWNTFSINHNTNSSVTHMLLNYGPFISPNIWWTCLLLKLLPIQLWIQIPTWWILPTRILVRHLIKSSMEGRSRRWRCKGLTVTWLYGFIPYQVHNSTRVATQIEHVKECTGYASLH